MIIQNANLSAELNTLEFAARNAGVTLLSKPDPNESRIRAINDISQAACLSEEECEALGIEF